MTGAVEWFLSFEWLITLLGFWAAMLLLLPIVILGFTVHEYSHALCARKLGDNTAYDQGRVSLNPLKHVEKYGLLFFVFLGFGWANPVPLTRENLRNHRRDVALICLAGPLSNLVLGVFLCLYLKALFFAYSYNNVDMCAYIDILSNVLWLTAYINFLLFIFNMLPIPPLDGGRVMLAILNIKGKKEESAITAGLVVLLLVLAATYVQIWADVNIVPIFDIPENMVEFILNGVIDSGSVAAAGSDEEAGKAAVEISFFVFLLAIAALWLCAMPVVSGVSKYRDKKRDEKWNNVEALCDRGVDYLDNGDYDKAIADFDRAIRLGFKVQFAYYVRGKAYSEKGEYDKAIADFDQAIRLDPEYARTYTSRGIAYVNKGEHEKAIADFDSVIRLDPDEAYTYYNRGLTYFEMDDLDKAAADCEQAIRIDPDDAETRRLLDEILQKRAENGNVANSVV